LNDQPLIYVDGVRVDSRVGDGLSNEGAGTPNGALGRLNDYNPEDIESIEIIKGPPAATLYGTEAANGVVQIITERWLPESPTTAPACAHFNPQMFDPGAIDERDRNPRRGTRNGSTSSLGRSWSAAFDISPSHSCPRNRQIPAVFRLPSEYPPAITTSPPASGTAVA